MMDFLFGCFILAWFSFGVTVIRNYIIHHPIRFPFDKSKVKYFDGDNT